MFLETERLILRKVQEADFEGYFREYLRFSQDDEETISIENILWRAQKSKRE